MSILKNIFILIWRIWLFVWGISTILLFFPILVVVISKEKWYPVFYKIAHYWARVTLFIMGFSVNIEMAEKILPNKSYLFCPNHTSMIDIFLMLAISKNPFVFIGKKELVAIPVFGYVYKKTCILVDRDNLKSRQDAVREAQKRLNNGLSICIFPEGKVPDDESIILDEFQNGAFRLAIEFQIPIVPMSFYDCKKRFSYTFFSGGPGVLRVGVHPFLRTFGLVQKDKNNLKQQTFQIIYNSLTADQQKLAFVKVERES